MHVRVLTPEEEVLQTSAITVTLITELGAIQIFPGHASLHGVIELSPLRIEVDQHTALDFVVRKGFVFIDQEADEITIQVYACQKKDELTHVTLKEYLELLLRHLKNHEQLGAYHLRYLEEEQKTVQKQYDLLEEKK